MKNCPFCAELIQDAARKCKHCGEFLDTPTPLPGKAQTSESGRTTVRSVLMQPSMERRPGVVGTLADNAAISASPSTLPKVSTSKRAMTKVSALILVIFGIVGTFMVGGLLMHQGSKAGVSAGSPTDSGDTNLDARMLAKEYLDLWTISDDHQMVIEFRSHLDSLERKTGESHETIANEVRYAYKKLHEKQTSDTLLTVIQAVDTLVPDDGQKHDLSQAVARILVLEGVH